MKILFNSYINLFPGKHKKNYGGPQVFTQSFAKFIEHTKHNYIGLVLNGKKELKNEFRLKVKREKDNAWALLETYLYIKKFIKSPNGKPPKETSKKINLVAKIIKSFHPDVVFLNGFSVINWYLLKAAAQLKLPIVTVHQGLWFKEIEAIKGVSKSAVSLLRNMEKEIPKLTTKEVFFNRMSYREYSSLLAKVSSKKLTFINLPYHPAYLNKKLLTPPKGQKVKIGFVGRWDPIKNPEMVLRLAREAKKRKLPWEFYAVTKLVKSRHLRFMQRSFSKYVRILPQTDARGLKKFYQAMNLLILPSRFDVSPNVVMEAALQNRGTIISKNVGWTDLYKQTGMGAWIDDFKNPDNTIKRVARLANQAPSKKLYNYIVKNHNPKKIMGSYVSLFEQLIHAKRL